MKTVLVTGSKGFIGKNLMEALSRREGLKVYGCDIDDNELILEAALKEADVVFHLAGVNRPEREEEFYSGNAALTDNILSVLIALKRAPLFVLSSSTQAELDNPYGSSKRKAEDLVFEFGEKSSAPVHVYRLNNVFGKWCRPNYNSVVATFCHNIARDKEIFISDESREIELVYIDDVISSFLKLLESTPPQSRDKFSKVQPVYKITLSELAGRIREFRNIRKTLIMPDFADRLTRCLYATYLSYLDENDFAYGIDVKRDQRGSLAELIKSRQFGQIFISKTHGGIIRGNHYHDTKAEKFCVIQGEAVIRFRHVLSNELLSYKVSGNDLKIVDIPPGYTHSIENISNQEMIVLFWADETFDPDRPDTYADEVMPSE